MRRAGADGAEGGVWDAGARWDGVENAHGVEAWEEVERAEERLEQRSGQRTAARERRRRRARVARWTARVLLPLAGAAVLVGVLERSGGDLGGWSDAGAAAFLAAVFLVPALVAGWLARGHGLVEAAAWAVGTAAIQGALVFGVAFALLGYGPA